MKIHSQISVARAAQLLFTVAVVGALSACAAEVGSDDWCVDLKEKPKGDWTITESKDYAKHCIFK